LVFDSAKSAAAEASMRRSYWGKYYENPGNSKFKIAENPDRHPPDEPSPKT
jgi:hypothetical protein